MHYTINNIQYTIYNQYIYNIHYTIPNKHSGYDLILWQHCFFENILAKRKKCIFLKNMK